MAPPSSEIEASAAGRAGTEPGARAEPAGPWYAGLEPKHWRILTASFLGWVFDGYEAYALFIVMPFALKAILSPAQLAEIGRAHVLTPVTLESRMPSSA